ncbi:class F sortase [Microbacteriaceae bacterium VKM Ac-2855]|nr:class F sortase [Microbacteriaceae bacterium VKM Ac-2855]
MTTSDRRRPSRRSLLFYGLAGALGAGGISAIWAGAAQSGAVESAPIPTATVSVPPSADVSGPTGAVEAPPVQTNAGPMTVDRIEPLHYFVPALGAYSLIVPTSGFAESRYAGFDSLAIPSDSSQSAWYDDGGALAGNEPGTTGTTVLASHVSYNGQWGVLRDLYTMQGGELVYVVDAAGTLSAWKVVQVYSRPHTDFPQEYWSADGPRRLVLITCGDYDDSAGHYLENIFAVAAAVDPVTGQPIGAV